MKLTVTLESDDGAETEYEVRGTVTRGYRGDRTNPPEPEEFDITSIVDMQGNDVTQAIEDSPAFQKVADEIYTKALETLAEAAGAAAEDEADYRREERRFKN